MLEVKLPSGATLRIGDVPFAVAKEFYQTLLEEAKAVAINKDEDVSNLVKNFFCQSFSSRRLELALKPCLERCTYNNAKITDETFEPAAARGDYTKVCAEVGKHTVDPFLKSLYADYKTAMQVLVNILQP